MRACPSCGGPLALEVREGRELERCTRQGCGYRAWIVPPDRTVAKPKLGGWGVKLTLADDMEEGGV